MASALPPIASDKDRCDALVALYKALRDHLVPPAGHLVGFNYWGGWEGQDTSIVDKVGDKYFLNFRGQILQTFFMNNGGVW